MYKGVKRFYFYLTYFLNLLRKKIYFDGDVKELSFGFESDSYFGYFDDFPENGDLVAFNAIVKSNRIRYLKSRVSIVVYSISKRTFKVIGHSRAFNFQQGSRLRWVSGLLFYNDVDEEGTGLIKCWNPLTNDISSYEGLAADFVSTTEVISFSYLGLKDNKYEYSYPNLLHEDVSSFEIIKLDIVSGTKLMLCDSDCLRDARNANKQFSKRYINHLLVSPEKDRFIFLLRYENNKEKWDYLMLGSTSVKNVSILAEGYFSHFAWKDNDNIVFYGKINGLRGYFLFNILSLEVSKLPIRDHLDGHMSIDGNEMVYDTYPGWNGRKELWLYNFDSCQSRRLGCFRNNPSYFGPSRCDLHPRVKDNLIYIDSNHNGRRRLYRLQYES